MEKIKGSGKFHQKRKAEGARRRMNKATSYVERERRIGKKGIKKKNIRI